jgi:hypothetical protein
MDKAHRLTWAGIIRLTLALALGGILLIALYDLFHPHNNPSLGTAIVVFVSAALVFFIKCFSTLPCPRSGRRAILLLFFIGFLIRLAVIIGIPNKQVSDFQIFHELAVALSNGKGLAYDGPAGLGEDVALYRHHYGANGPLPTAFRMPGTPLATASLYALFGPREILPKILNALLGAGIGICLLLLMWGNDPRRAFWAGLFWEMYPGPWFNTNLLGTEIHFTFGIALIAVLLTRTFADDTGDAKNAPRKIPKTFFALATDLVMGCTCLIRPSTQLIL